ncbi:MAG: peptidylprolyl isomerase [Candidatus Omnitrophica bacterium]|nr:peptidylprolyl isomerase [Candidatus Omnitrophota bacterium]
MYSVLLFTVHCSLFTPCEAGNRIVAVVNDEIITEWDLTVRMSALMEEQEQPFENHDEAAQFRRAVLRRLIEERLLIQEGRRMNVTVELEEVAARVQELRRQFAPRERYEAMLQEAQLTEEQLKTKLREQLLMQRTIDQKIRATIVISPAEVQGAIKTVLTPTQPTHSAEGDVLVAHLLVRVSEQRSLEEARRLVEQLSQRLLSGEPFDRLAKDYSEGPHAEDGGHLGWVKPSEMIPELSEALSQLKPGEVSKPIHSHLGFHLVKVLERREPSSDDSPNSQDAVHHRLYQAKFVKAMQAWLDDLKRSAYIQVMEE